VWCFLFVDGWVDATVVECNSESEAARLLDSLSTRCPM
jgi:hypothetical protein